MSEELVEDKGEGGEIDKDVLGKYEGMRNHDNQRHGLGFALLPNGDAYDGQYKFGKRHGKGIYVFRNGARYHGDYRLGMKHGIGKFIYPDGSTYEGEWKKDEKHGYGLYKYSNGDHYEGSWRNGKRNGYGTYYHKKDEIKYTGFWVKGKRHGNAQVHYPNSRHHGRWENNVPIGEGCFTFGTNAIQRGRYVHLKDPDLVSVTDDNDDAITDDDGENKETSAQDGPLKDIIPVWRPEEYIPFCPNKVPVDPFMPPRTPSDVIAGEEGFDDDGDDEASQLDLLPGEDGDIDFSEYDIPEYLNYFLDDEIREKIEFFRESIDVLSADERLKSQLATDATEMDKLRDIICGPGSDVRETEKDEKKDQLTDIRGSKE